MKKVFKYATGQEIPEGAEYLSTQVETRSHTVSEGKCLEYTYTENILVWHYFLVEVKTREATNE